MSKFTPSPQEVFLVNQIFAQADSQKVGFVGGEAAVKIFNGSKLSPTILAEIWSIADEDDNGVLTRKGVAIAVRLLGHAQRGEKVTEALIHKPGPVPVIDGLIPPPTQQTTGVPLPKSPSPSMPPLTAQDRAKFMKLFIGCSPINGLLSGEKARDVFVKSKLPVDKLSQIWNLADTKGRGVLDATDFTIAMYLIQGSMSGQIQFLHTTLPPGLYEQAAGDSGFKAVAAHATGESGSFSPSMNNSFSGRPVSTVQPQYTGQMSALQPQMTGQSRQSPAPPLPARSALANNSPAFPFLQQQTTGLAPQWDVTPAEKANADRIFDGLDAQKRSYIEGDIAVPFMLLSKLPEDVLAHVWDLADLNNDGRLTREGFAVALHLIQGKLAGKEVPATIPQTLVPPSMRSQAPAPAVPSQPSVQDSIRDLIWDDSPSTSATIPQPQPVLQPQSTGTLSPRRTAFTPPQRSQTMDPFSSSPFGISAPPVHKDLLGDDDEPAATSPPLQDQSAEIGNVKNQLGSTNRSLDTAKAERANVERVLAEQAAQLSAVQTQLSSAKAAYETETRLLSALRERHALQTAEIQKSREELIHAESDLSGLRVEKAEIEGAVLRDKEEVRDLQRKMTEVGMQVETLKVDVEKAKKEAKQQKGLLAIAKKQLATREAERAKVEKEREETQKEAHAATAEREEAEAELAKEVPTALTNGHEVAGATSPDILAMAVAQPLPVTPEISSPTTSVMSFGGKSNNPFERVALASGPQSRSQSPFLPFTNSAVLPSPPTVPAETSADSSIPTPSNPFRFDDVFNMDEPQEVPAAPTGATELAFIDPAKEDSTTTLALLANSDLLSPTGTDVFSTPPTTATISTDGANPTGTVEVPAARFPALDAVATDVAIPTAQANQPDEPLPQGTERQTDLDHQLQELEVDESESESDSDEDNEPLANVKDRLSVESTAKPANGSAHPPVAPVQPAPELSTFDDSFSVITAVGPAPAGSPPGSSTPMPIQPAAAAAGPTPATNNVFDAAFTPSPMSNQPPNVQVPPVAESVSMANGTSEESAAGVNDFDEAMGKLSNSASNTTSQFSQFSFDSAFDDNFDFAAATAAVNPPNSANGTSQPAVAPPQNGGFDNIFMSPPSGSAAAPVVPPVNASPFAQSAPETKTFSFDDAFSAGTSDTQRAAGPSGPGNGPHAISFDDAFGGNPSDALAFDSTFGGAIQQSPVDLPPQSNNFSAPFPTLSPPTSPMYRTSSPEYMTRRSVSPPLRQTSPPPRHSSPKLRPSTASSDKVPPTTRHSKLSIRLPFGRKKKTHDAPPLPSILATQVVEDPTPAVEDDVDAVKQLCGMGFSRTQAVTALEMHGYDVQRALNSLLGQ